MLRESQSVFFVATLFVSGCETNEAQGPAGTTSVASMDSGEESGSPADRESSEVDDAAARMKANGPLLDEASANGLWFHALKMRPVWVRQLEAPQRVHTLEGEEEVPAGAFLCRGEAGDIWPQTAESLESRYVATEEYDDDGWRKYTPHPDNEGVMAARIVDEFSVEAAWGTLNGKPGDYVLKNYSDRDVASPEDVWIVDQELFRATYTTVEQ